MQLTRYQRRRAELVRIMGGACVQCAATENLEIDHIDRSTKSFTVTSHMTYSWEAILAEARKCQLLCSDCHLTKSQAEATKEVHGTWGQYKNRKCRCTDCRGFINNYMNEYKKRRRAEARSRQL